MTILKQLNQNRRLPLEQWPESLRRQMSSSLTDSKGLVNECVVAGVRYYKRVTLLGGYEFTAASTLTSPMLGSNS